MANPLAAYVILPLDTGNTGKNVRTQTRVVSGNTVHEHFFIPTIQYQVLSHYFFSSTQQTPVSATTQNGTTTGFFWFANIGTTSTISAVIRRIICDCNAGSALATPTAPLISFTKFTYTGTASGATVTPVKWQTAAPLNQLTVYTASTGMTVSLVGDIGAFSLPSAETAVGCFYGTKEVISKNPLAYQRGFDLEIAPNEGIVVYQSTTSTSSDTRKINIQMEWDEVDLS
jgi:hypothetical protein